MLFRSLVAKMFEADMTEFQFVFSKDACIKTCIYFAVMYVAVMFFNTFTVSKYKLINLLNASKKNEKVKIKNPIICVLVFIIACIMLGWAYWKVTGDVHSLSTADKILPPILMGICRYYTRFLVFIRICIKSGAIHEKYLFKRDKYVCIKAN